MELDLTQPCLTFYAPRSNVMGLESKIQQATKTRRYTDFSYSSIPLFSGSILFFPSLFVSFSSRRLESRWLL
jgi:hypothetical protein